MKKTPGVIYLIAAVMLIVIGIVTTTIISSVKDKQPAADIRAKAGVTNTLKLTGVVSAVNDLDGTISVNDVQFSQESRSGDPKNYGTWIVTPPQTFSLGSAAPGVTLSFTVETSSFNVASKRVTAVQMSVGK